MADETPDTPNENSPPTGQPEGSSPGDGQLDDAVSKAAEEALSDAEDALGDIAQSASSEEITPEAMEQMQAAAATAGEIRSHADSSASGAQPVELPNLTMSTGDARHEIDLLADVDLDVTIELGRTRMLVEDVLRLDEGVVVELDKLAGDPVDVYVNNRLVARGEVLVLNDNFCVRVNEILAPIEEEHDRE